MTEKAKVYHWPEHFDVGVLKKPGLDTPNVVKKWTSVLAEDTGMKIHLAYSDDYSKATKYKWLRYGIVDIADGGTADFSEMLEGGRHFGNRDTGPFQVRAIWIHSKYDAGYMVRGDSYIKDIYDIKPGIKVVDMRSHLPPNSPLQRNLQGLLAWAGINNLENGVEWVKAASTEDKAQLIVDGKADIAYAVTTSPATYEAEKNPYGIRWIDLNPEKDPEGAKRFREKSPMIPDQFAPMFRGVQSCRGHWGLVGTDHLCSREDADTEFIYNLSKWLDENWTRYKDMHPWLEHTTRKNLMEKLDTTFIPCHDGLIKYLNELGLWTSAHQKRQEENLDTMTRYCKASQNAMWLADEKSIVVSPDNAEWVELWENHKREQGLPVFENLPSLRKG